MLREKLKNYHIILASGSPRRQLFFKELNIDFEIRLKPVKEEYPPRLKHFEISDYLSQLNHCLLKKNLTIMTSLLPVIPLCGITTTL